MAEGGAKILVAEDMSGVAQPIVDHLTVLGYDARWVRTVREARRELSEFSPDLLLLDTTLDNDGLELFQALRFAPEHPPGGVIILVEPGDVPTRERAQQLGAAAVLMKPIRDDELTNTIEDLLTFI
jgi:DNA-binding response OmpR family regulator